MAFIPANRWQAFGLHILASLIVFLLLASVIYFYWYPGFLFHYDGGLDGIKLIAGVDFLIGPFLTLCVYKLGKPSLKFDLTVIGLLQVACLVGGMWTVWNTRPVAVVYAMGTFRTISYGVFVDYGVKPDQVPLLQGRWPVWVAVDQPAEALPVFRNITERLKYQNDLYFRTELYVPYDSFQPQAMKDASTVAEKVARDPLLAGPFAAFSRDARVYGLACGSGGGYMIRDASDRIEGIFIDMTRKGAYEVLLEKLQVQFMKLRNLPGQAR